MRVYRCEGIIIKRSNSGESDRIITVLTKDRGKILLRAKGVRKITSRRAPNLELFNYVTLSVYGGTHSHYITEVSVIHSFDGIRNDLKTIAQVFELCEIMNILTREGQDVEGCFELLYHALLRLDEKLQVKTEEFKFQTLQTLGFVAEHDMYVDIDHLIRHLTNRQLLGAYIYEQ